eukprot:5791170-Pyramimonas_sp.AAC.1
MFVVLVLAYPSTTHPTPGPSCSSWCSRTASTRPQGQGMSQGMSQGILLLDQYSLPFGWPGHRNFEAAIMRPAMLPLNFAAPVPPTAWSE